MKITFRNLAVDEPAPMSLLLLADPSDKLVQQYLKSGHCHVAEADGQIIGVIVLAWKDPSTLEIMNLAVTEAMQGRGIGKQLIYYGIQEARRLGAKTLEIGTGNSSIYQLLLYQKCGFRIVEIETDYFVRHYEDAIFENGIPCVDRILLRMNV